ncbi:MAG: exonuclease SbcCD subunit D C-terminal domain-containing protein [Burkholderiales bacterium]|nr:exonuclease SbcCD subunit D C-terminal domain-containing protein [Burkholderiales bacterium]
MKILHTSDWHLGRTLYGKKRYAEFQLFLDWMLQTIEQEKPDILLIAGDIFDTTTPSNKTQELYYQFLCKVSINTDCRHIVIIGGNHDSPTLLNAPSTILKQLKIHVIGSMMDRIEDELLVLNDSDNNIIALICAVPYLRDSDLRLVENNESGKDKSQKLVDGIKEHYAKICDLAVKKRKQLDANIPIIGLGHLFASGGKAGDGVRELYIGTLGHFNAAEFPTSIDYLALGHLHIPQIVNHQEHIRYSGSPLAMGFGEINQQKIILRIQFDKQHISQISQIAIPKFQELARINGNIEELIAQLPPLIAHQTSIWVEATYTGNEIITNLHQQLQNIVSNSNVELIKTYNLQLINQILVNDNQGITIYLNDLTPTQVFDKCLQINKIPIEQQEVLKNCYQQIISELSETDMRAE